MIDEPSEGPSAGLALGRSRHGGPASRRELCIWLGTLASWRGGLVRKLVRECGAVSEVLDASPGELAALIRPPGVGQRSQKAHPVTAAQRPDRVRDRHGADREVEEQRFAAALKARPDDVARMQERSPHSAVVAWCDSLYPAALRQLADPPLCLFVRARCDDKEIARRLDLLGKVPAVAIVGTRGPSPYGTEMAAALGRDLTVRGVLVISGLALGIDATAQAAAIDAAKASQGLATVAVLGCGPDVVYPQANARLREEVARRGLLVSEFAWGVPARPWRFPARNRVMAALSLGVVVVEGASRSGARITAGYALELGREVLAVPGEAGRRLTEAPHDLLRSGAPLCESAADVVAAIATAPLDAEALAGALDKAAVARLLERGSDNGRRSGVLRALERGPMTADQVAKDCAVRVYEACALLSELEIDGLATLTGGGLYRLKRR
jgi:DNA processing protein